MEIVFARTFSYLKTIQMQLQTLMPSGPGSNIWPKNNYPECIRCEVITEMSIKIRSSQM
jgi:hypothetical protein